MKRCKDHISFFVLVAVCLLSLNSCSDQSEDLRKQQWVEKEVYLRIKAFKEEKRNECYMDIVRTAEIEVDSILSQKDLFGNVLDKEAPAKPSKPEFVPIDARELQNHEVKRE